MDVRTLPIAVRSLVLTVAVGGVACLLARVPDLPNWTGGDLLAFVILASGIVLTEQFQIPVHHGTDRLNFSLTEALWVGGLILCRPSVVTMAVAAGVLAGQAMRRLALHKAAFNVGQFLLALTVAQVVVAALRSTQDLRPMTFLAVGLGMAGYAALNAALVALVISLAQGKPFGSVLLPPLPENALHFAANSALGLAAVVLWQAAPAALPLLALPLAMSFLAYRTLLAAARAGGRAPATG
jgi:hypothetical protein